jgi:HEAT repeat protein
MKTTFVNKHLWFSICCVLFLARAIPGAEPPIAELIAAATSGAEPSRIKAIDELAAQGEKAAPAVGPLIKLLVDSSTNVRAHAAHALGEIGAPAKPAAAALVSLVKDGDPTVRRQAIQAIAAIRPGPQVTIPLFVQLVEDPDPGVRQRVLQAVSEAGTVAIPGLIEALKHEKAAYWACLILRDMGPQAKAAVPALTALLKDPRVEIRREAALALGAMEADAAPAASQIAPLLDDEHVQGAATFALGQIRQLPAGAEAKIRAHAKSQNKVLSTVSLWTLARVHPEDKPLAQEAAQQLVARLTDQDAFVRVAAARALSALQLDPEITFPIFERALATADEQTTRHALDALATLGPRAVPRLINALKHDTLRVQAAYTLGQIGPQAAEATQPLAGLVGDANSKVASEAAMALAKIGPAAKASVPALVAALEKPECDSAHAIIYALGKIGPDASAAKPALVKRVTSDASLAVLAAWAITQIDPRSSEVSSAALPALVAGLGDASPESRQMAVHALASINPLPPAAMASLEKAAQDTDPAVREAAAEALRTVRAKGTK